MGEDDLLQQYIAEGQSYVAHDDNDGERNYIDNDRALEN
jgi:hypothetical protein